MTRVWDRGGVTRSRRAKRGEEGEGFRTEEPLCMDIWNSIDALIKVRWSELGS